jgi:hypothetical protein
VIVDRIAIEKASLLLVGLCCFSDHLRPMIATVYDLFPLYMRETKQALTSLQGLETNYENFTKIVKLKHSALFVNLLCMRYVVARIW